MSSMFCRRPTTEVAVVALPPASMSGIGAIVDTLRMANEIQGQPLYNVKTYSSDGYPIISAGGAQHTLSAVFDDFVACDWLIVLSERFQRFAEEVPFVSRLSLVGRRTPLVIGVHHGIWWLAMAGHLSGYRVSANWETYQEFSEQYERSVVTRQIFEIDRNRATCAGGQATVDLLLELIRRQHGADLFERIGDALVIGSVRTAEVRQRIPFITAAGEGHPRLTDVLLLMEENIEDPLTTDEIAERVGISRRQLERMFRKHLDSMPSKYYMTLRLERARGQLQRTSKSVMQIGLSCGFSSAAHFSNVYRERFARTPREERREWLAKQTLDAHSDPAAAVRRGS
jgi:transcriptional regulator GlxA family with amidase domain